MPGTEPHARPTSKAWLWPAGIVVLLSSHVLAMGVVVFIATRDPSFAVEPQAYRKALAWDESRAQGLASERLGWGVNLEVAKTEDPLGRRRVTCRLRDSHGVAVVAATVRLEAFPHARGSERLRVTLEPAPDGTYHAMLPLHRSGIWEFRLSASRGAEQFRSVVTENVENRS